MRTVMLYVELGVQFIPGMAIEWNNGAPPRSVLPDNGSGVGGWINAGLRVAVEVLPAHPKAEMVRDYLRSAVQEPDRRIDWAEWWAAAAVVVGAV
jgi:hypothetical protein